MILALGYSNTGRYWGGSGIGRYFFDWNTIPISAHSV